MTLTASIEVACPTCDSRFPVDPRKIPSEGVHAICGKCWRTFSVDPVEREEESASVEHPETGVEPTTVEDLDTGAEPTSAENLETAAETVAVEEVETEEEEASVEDLETAAESVAVEEMETEEESVSAPSETDPGVEEASDAGPSAPPAASPAAESSVPTAEPEWSPFEDLREVSRPPSEAGPSKAEAAPTSSSPFGRRDPHDRAQRLARVLVSDMITYHPERHARALEEGTLEEEFEDEVKRSWAEYVDQVGAEIAEGTRYFQDALNDILARGRRVY